MTCLYLMIVLLDVVIDFIPPSHHIPPQHDARSAHASTQRAAHHIHHTPASGAAHAA